MNYKVHLDGYNLVPYLTGQATKSPRESFFYINDDQQVVALRYDNWKVVFMEQRANGQMLLWANPFTSLLTRAADRLYAEPVSLADTLRAHPLVTLHTISSEPERFGRLQPFGETELRRQRIADLITTARIYLAHEHKMQRDNGRQGQLALPKQSS